ncbi:nuclear transport factor 2 family protein [Microbacterium sp. NPDC076768]|uniref:nuclear transport factor 2 family protein n=1 Tax=Microbacterium sp. NPDC076768 TaxID=3154858 RepID=UPI003432BD0B
MNAGEALLGLMTAIDEHRWDDLEQYLHPQFTCVLVHTNETFSRDEWVRFNAEYPDFDRLVVQEFVGGETEAACRSHVTGRTSTGTAHFQCASFVRVKDGQILHLTEVWTDVNQSPPPGTRLCIGRG